MSEADDGAGSVVHGDDESWSADDPNLCVHVYVPNLVQPSMGYIQGWMHYMDLMPLDANDNPPPRAEISDYAIQRMRSHSPRPLRAIALVSSDLPSVLGLSRVCVFEQSLR